MRKETTLKAGDRIAYAAAFLKAIGADYNLAQRRGTFVGFEGPIFGRVHWDDEDARIAAREGQYAEQDYCDDVRERGSLVGLKSICRVGTARFADTYA